MLYFWDAERGTLELVIVFTYKQAMSRWNITVTVWVIAEFDLYVELRISRLMLDEIIAICIVYQAQSVFTKDELPKL